MLVKVVREKSINGAIPSKIYVDGDFVCYGLENDLYKIPNGVYSAYGMTSPKFGTEKVYLNVPDRTGVLFHGGNTKDATKGCILCARNRDGDTISGDFSDELFKIVNNAYLRGESIAVQITDQLVTKTALFLIVAGIAAAFYFTTKK